MPFIPHRLCKQNDGFTLVELSVVLVIISLLTTAGLAIGTSMVKRAAHLDTRKLMDMYEATLKDYYVAYGRLPCVAELTTAVGDNDFGVELGTGGTTCNEGVAATGDTERVDVGGGVMVRVGMLPVRTLGLPDTAASDKFGNRILYAVTERLTDAADFGAAPGAITVKDAADNDILTEAAYFIGSFGEDHKGAYLYRTGTVQEACGATANLDVMNCTLTTADFRDAPFNNGEQEATFFDDQVRWSPKYLLSAITTESSSLWAETGDDVFVVGTDSDPATGNVGIGTNSPTQKLHVAGHINIEGISGHGTINGPSGDSGKLEIKASLSGAVNGASIDLNGRNPAIDSGRIGYLAATDAADDTDAHYFGKRSSANSISELAVIRSDGVFEVNSTVGGQCKMGSAVGPVSCPSDERYKKDITQIPDAVEKISQLRGVYYRWNEKSSVTDKDSLHLGVIAQEVQKVFPEAVMENDEGYLAVSLGSLVPALIEAVHELDGKNKALQAQLDAMEARILALEETNEAKEQP